MTAPRALFALVAALGCSAARPVAPTPVALTAPAPRRARPARDTAEVAAPAGLMLTLRVGSLQGFALQAATAAGIADVVRGLLDQIFTGNPGAPLFTIVERDAEATLLVVGDDGDFRAVFALGGPALDVVEQRLSNTHRLEPLPDGSYRVVALEPPADAAPPDALARCVVTPTPAQSATRVVCSERLRDAERIAPYIARTLARRPLAADTAVATLELEPFREFTLRDEIAALDRRLADADAIPVTASDCPSPAGRAGFRGLAREMAENLRSLLVDPVRLSAEVRVEGNALVARGALVTRGPSGTLLRAGVDALRGQPAVPDALTAQLVPAGLLYGAGTVDLRPFRAVLNRGVAAMTGCFRGQTHFTPAVEADLHTLFDWSSVLDRTATATVVGLEPDGAPWIAATLRAATVSATQVVAQARAALGAWRRLRAVRLGAGAILDPTAATTRRALVDTELPLAGLPAGSFGVRFAHVASARAPRTVAPARHPGDPRARPHPGATAVASDPDAPLEFLVVPVGPDLEVFMARDARALFARSRANVTPAVDPSALRGPGFALAFMPTGLRALRTPDRRLRAVLQLLEQTADHGQSPSVLHIDAADDQGQTRVGLELTVPGSTLQVLIATLLASM